MVQMRGVIQLSLKVFGRHSSRALLRPLYDSGTNPLSSGFLTYNKSHLPSLLFEGALALPHAHAWGACWQGSRGFLSTSASGQDKEEETPASGNQSEAETTKTAHPQSDDSDNEAGKEDLLGLLAEREALLEQKDKVIAELKDRMLRSLAEVENVRTRSLREAENSKKYAIQSFAKDLLDVSDNLSRAAATIPESIRNEPLSDDSPSSLKLLKSLLEGVDMTQKQLLQAFGKNGVERFDPLGEQFDPTRHLALFELEDPSKTAGSVACVSKVGYMLHDRLLRPAEVGVVKSE